MVVLSIEEHTPTLRSYQRYEDSDDGRENFTIWVMNRDRNVKPYTYDEAINMAGHGLYSIGLLAVNCLALFSMTLEMFAFPIIITGSACDLQLGSMENYVLLSVPFIGAIFSAYIWGYISDTRGRRCSLEVAMWGSFICSFLSAFSHSWIVMAVLKFVSVCFCSSAQSITYTLVGESCPSTIKDLYFVILTTCLNLTFPIYISLGYFSLRWEFLFDLYFITFTPWRLLAIILALPLGLSAFGLHFFYESPKFLINNGNERLALEILKKIWTRNRCTGKQYIVKKLILNEEGNICTKDKYLLKSMWEQTTPLFKMPLLLRTMQIYYLVFVVYVTSNSVLIWFPYLASEFISGISTIDTVEGLCDIIHHSQTINTTVGEQSCTPKLDGTVVWATVTQGLMIFLINLCSCRIASKRKLRFMAILTTSCVCAVGCAAFNYIYISIAMFFVIPITTCNTGILYSYFVYLYPTSYRSMASCLAVLVARFSGLVCVNVVGLFIMSHCASTFYFIAAKLLCGLIVAYFLPSDKTK